MKQRISIICTILMMVLLVVGCGPTQTGTTGTTHQVTDGTGVAVTVPNEPKAHRSRRCEHRGYRVIFG